MTTTFLPFSKPTLSPEAIEEVTHCLQSGWLTTGPRTQRFEEMLKKTFSRPYALCCSSATAGLHMALMALPLQPGDEVITTPLTFIATLNAIVLAGGKPVLVDINPHTLNFDLDQVESAITPRTRALLPVHFAGLPIDLDILYALAKKYDLRVIEDCAHAIGAEYKNRKLGSFGDIQVFSFHPNKNITTGEGGCILTRDKTIAKQIELFRFHGIDPELHTTVLPGYKFNFTDLQAAIGLHQLPQLSHFIEQRTTLVRRYYDTLKEWDTLTLPSAPSYSHLHAWHLFTPCLTPQARVDRQTFIHTMKEQNIGIGLHYRAAHLQPYYQKEFGFQKGQFPHAEWICDRIVSLPLFPTMRKSDQDRVIDAMANILNVSR